MKLSIGQIVVGTGVLVLVFVGYTFARTASLERKVGSLQNELASTTALLATKTDADKTVTLSDQIYTVEQNLKGTQQQLGIFESTIGKISGAVGTLEKLSRTDPELLQKYSKVYFLNEHYKPESLSYIGTQYLYSESRVELIESRVAPHLKDMLDAATSTGITVYVKSAYRSFAEQAALKSAYTVSYGSGANRFSADQGYSEHQLGTTVDLITTGTGGALTGFEKTAAYQWLLANAYRYGFVLSYPQGNSYYIFEPWHWRFVGVKLSTYLHDQGKNFYDLEQRQIDEYLINIFD